MGFKTLKAMLLVTAIFVVGRPAPADAQWFVEPFVGGNFGDASEISLTGTGDAETEPWSLGTTVGWMHGWWGAEGDVAYAPRFFDSDEGFISRTSLWTAMANGRIQIPWGTMGGRFKPYGSGGVGLIRPDVAEPGGLAEVKDNKVGWNAGAGVVTRAASRLGIRTDIRYFRSMDDDSPNTFGIDFDKFNFWRASVGAAFTW